MGKKGKQDPLVKYNFLHRTDRNKKFLNEFWLRTFLIHITINSPAAYIYGAVRSDFEVAKFITRAILRGLPCSPRLLWALELQEQSERDLGLIRNKYCFKAMGRWFKPSHCQLLPILRDLNSKTKSL